MNQRLTCDRFYGGVEERIQNLQSFLGYLWRSSPTTNETAAWLENELGGSSQKTRDRYLSFLRGINLVEQVGSQLHPGPAGVRYLKQPDPEELFLILDAGVAGFDLMVEALAVQGPLSDEELRLVLNAGPYGHDNDGTGVAIRHREWLEALGFARQKRTADRVRRTELTEAGYELWRAYEDGEIGKQVVSERDQARSEAPLQSIPDDPVPDPSETNSLESSAGDDGTDRTETRPTRESLREATKEHQRALDRFRDQLESSGYRIYKTRYSDLIAFRDPDDRILLFEIKSITSENAWAQTRKAVGQVFEYEYTDIEQREELSGAVQTGILLSRPPPMEVQEYLAHLSSSRGVLVVWWHDELAGPSRDAVIECLNADR